MTEFSVGYTIYNSAPLIPSILRGIADCFPEESEVILVFDHCTDHSYHAFQEHRHLLGKRPVTTLRMNRDLYETRSNNLLIKTFKKDVLAIFQDDMICVDVEICGRVCQIIEAYDNGLGLIGCRDGFDVEDGYRTRFVKNKWSPSPSDGYVLRTGEYRERCCVNRGPIFLTRSLLAKVSGFSDEFYPGSWDDRDFCCRAKYLHNLRNIVMFSKIGTRHKDTVTSLDAPMLHRLNGRVFFRKWRRFVGEPRHPLADLLWDVIDTLSRPKALRRQVVSKHAHGPRWLWHTLRKR